MPNFQLDIEEVRRAFPQYIDIQPLPVGGQKLVYCAVNAGHQAFALKLIQQDNGLSDQRMIREIMAAGKLKAPYFAKIFEANHCTIDNTNCICIVEEYISGSSLSEVLRQHNKLPLKKVRSIGLSLLNALIHVEKANLVHRDIKPGNIMLANDGRIMLIDFGIARHLDEKSVTASCAPYGPMTIGYCAPEQIQNIKRQISIRTDLFAVGVVLYEMAAGYNPFREGCRYAQEVVDRCLKENPPPLSRLGLPEDLSNFVQVCISKAGHRRIASAQKALEYFAMINWEV